MVPHLEDLVLHPQVMELHLEDLALHPQAMVLHLEDQVHKAVLKHQDKTVKVFQFRFQEHNKEEGRDLFVRLQEALVEEEGVDHLTMVRNKEEKVD